MKARVMKAIAFTSVALLTSFGAVSGASAQGVNLSGRWQCMAQCLGPPGGIAFITQYGWDLNVVNDVGLASRAWVDYPGHIWIDRANIGAIFSPDGFTLQPQRRLEPVGLLGAARSHSSLESAAPRARAVRRRYDLAARTGTAAAAASKSRLMASGHIGKIAAAEFMSCAVPRRSTGLADWSPRA